MFFSSQKFSLRKIPRAGVVKQFTKSVLEGNMEEACHWACEMDVSGFHEDFWDTSFLIAAKHLHVQSPKLPVFLLQKWNTYRVLMEAADDHYRRRKCLSRPQIDAVEKHWTDTWVEVVGALTLSGKVAPYELPRVEVRVLDDVLTQPHPSVHAWLKGSFEVRSQSGNHKTLVALLTRLLCFLEMGDFPRALYMLSLVMEHDSRSKKTERLLINPRKDRPLYQTLIKETSFSLSFGGVPDSLYYGLSQHVEELFLSNETEIEEVPAENVHPLMRTNATLRKQNSLVVRSDASKNAGDGGSSNSALVAAETDWVFLLFESLERSHMDGFSDEQNGMRIRNVAALHFMFSLGFTNPLQKKVRMPLVVAAMAFCTFGVLDSRQMTAPILSPAQSVPVRAAQQNIRAVMYEDIRRQRMKESQTSNVPLALTTSVPLENYHHIRASTTHLDNSVDAVPASFMQKLHELDACSSLSSVYSESLGSRKQPTFHGVSHVTAADLPTTRAPSLLPAKKIRKGRLSSSEKLRLFEDIDICGR